MPRTIKLICVTGDENHNKFYTMTELGDGNFDVHYGRVGLAGIHETYPMSKWDKIYKSKTTRKDQPYQDVTHLVSVETSNKEEDTFIDSYSSFSSLCRDLVNFLCSCARGVVKQNYTVKIADVTPQQVATAQSILDQLVQLSQKSWVKDIVNAKLLELYRTIPRKMNNTKNYLIQAEDADPDAVLQKILSNEQDILDTMSGQVNTQPQSSSSTNIKSSLSIDIKEASSEDIAEIKKLANDLDFSKVRNVFRVVNTRTEKDYVDMISKESQAKEILLYHGSRNCNWWNIINQGLKIRPSNAIHTGSMLGEGTYFANKARKSIGYTDLQGSYWANGSANKAYLALYKVNLGRTWDIIGPNKRYEYWMSQLNRKEVQAKGYDSLYARGGADLRNDEYVIFDENRSSIKYLIELKN